MTICITMRPSQSPDSTQEAVICIPIDRRLPRLRLRTRRADSLVGQRFVVCVDSWPAGSQFPGAHLQRLLGPMNDLRQVT